MRENSSTSSADKKIVVVPYGGDPLRALVERLAEDHAAELPDLSRHHIILATTAAAARLRALMLDAFDALIPPFIGTLDELAARFPPRAAERVLTDTERELRLYEALARFPSLRSRFGTWPLIDSLFALFDELSFEAAALPGSSGDIEAWLSRRYGARAGGIPAVLSEEARFVATLWTAWRKELAEENVLDSCLAQLAGLSECANRLNASAHVYLAGHARLPRTLRRWLVSLRCPVTLLLHGESDANDRNAPSPVIENIEALRWPLNLPPPRDDYADFLRAVYASQAEPIAERSRAQRAAVPVSPLIGRLAVLDALDAEQEARAVELQFRRWWLDGHRRLAMITPDRALARRVRALLDRAGLTVCDHGGWPLSTTSAAALIDAWLRCLGDDFSPPSLLDLLRSPFAGFGVTAPAKALALAALERFLLNDIPSSPGIGRYRNALRRHEARIDGRFGAGTAAALSEILQSLQAAAAAFGQRGRSRRRSLDARCERLLASLDRLGAVESYLADEVGREILALLEAQRLSAGRRAVEMNWREFRAWLHRLLERRHYRSEAAAATIEFFTSAQARLQCFDAVVIAGCTRDHLPGPLELTPFFNDEARAELGLTRLAQRYAERFYDFRRLLECAPRVLLTYRRYDGATPAVVSPWLERLEVFHELSYGGTLRDAELARLCADRKTDLAVRDAPPAEVVSRPAPSAARDLLPPALSAAAHQALLDCPYQFFTRHMLGLHAPAADELILASQFGRRVHRVLEAFRVGIAHLPGPWAKTPTQDNRDEAIALLIDISERVFARALHEDFGARAAYYRWLDTLPSYVDWEIARAGAWTFEAGERRHELALPAGTMPLTLVGRIDREDRAAGAQAIVDYKTGHPPRSADVAYGEAAQLPFYGLFLSRPREAALLVLRPGAARERVYLQNDELAHLIAANRERLISLWTDLGTGKAMPAWGDDETCRRCEAGVLCRKQMWPTEPMDQA